MTTSAKTALALAFGLTACSNSPSLPSASGIAGLLPQQRAARVQPDRGSSWMRPGAKSSALLYVSDTETGDVYVFSYPKGKAMGSITGLIDPAGECVDAKGNVFVTNTGGSNVVEYAHGGTTPIATLKDDGYFPVGCSVDPKTGNLAVTNFSTSASGPGNLVIYKKAKGKPKSYSNPAAPGFLLCGYDDAGNLFADAQTTASTPTLVELQPGKNAFVVVPLNATITSPGAVQWDGKYLAIGDQSDNVVSRFAIASGKGTLQGTTVLKNAIEVFQFWIEGANIIGPDSGNADVGIWKYPAGGKMQQSLRGVYVPLGAVVSNP